MHRKEEVMGMEIWVPCRVVCDSCGEVLDMGWSADPSRCRGGIGSARWARGVADEVAGRAKEAGWAVGTGRCYCPVCRKAINDGLLAPGHGDVTARGLVDELVTTMRSRHGRGL